jgi:hypothetical protein
MNHHLSSAILVLVIVLLVCWGPWTLALLRARKLDKRMFYSEAECKCDEQNGSSLCPIHRSGE